MILDAEGAVIDYLTEHMSEVVGNGNFTVEFLRYKFSDDSPDIAVRVYAELPDNDRDVPELFPVGMRITTRAPEAQQAFNLIQNIDLLLDKMTRINLNDNIQLMLSDRNAGPDRYDGPNNDMVYYTALYSMILRQR
jgi:hypothetical protein